MRTIETKIYKFEELEEQAKEKARAWYREGYDGAEDWDQIREDAREIGLKIFFLDQHRANTGEFITTARACAEMILKNHGETCETFTTARAYLKDIDALELDDDGEFVDGDRADDSTHEFLHALLEDYRIMFDHSVEYTNSDEAVDEAIIANEYEFTENGRRA